MHGVRRLIESRRLQINSRTAKEGIQIFGQDQGGPDERILWGTPGDSKQMPSHAALTMGFITEPIAMSTHNPAFLIYIQT